MNPPPADIDAADQALIEAACQTLARCYRDERHTVAAAARCGSGRIYTGVNIDTCGYGPCAEPIAIGAAITAGDGDVRAIVAVCREGAGYRVLSPCGNCRQLLVDYAPEAMVIFRIDRAVKKAPACHLLPGSFLGLDAC